MAQDEHIRRSRLPRGIASKNPVVMRLSNDEREELNAIAARESRSASSMARIIYLSAVKIAQDKNVKFPQFPRGIVSKNPVVMRLSNDEREELNAIAARESRSASSMARIIYLSAVQNFR